MDLLLAGIAYQNMVSEMKERMEMTDLTSEQLAIPSKYAGLGAAITAELMIGFWFGVMLAAGVADSLKHLIGAITRGK